MSTLSADVSTYSTRREIRAQQRAEPPKAAAAPASYTSAAWLLALSPLIAAAACLLLSLALLVAGGPAVPVLLLVVGVSLLLWTASLAMRDQKQLIAAGHRRTPSPFWFLLTPGAYLLARALRVGRETGAGWAPLTVWLVSLATPWIVVGALALADAAMVAP